MRKEYTDCNIVFDLLPLYMDGKTSEESKIYVRAHLEQCEECRQTYQFMQKDFGEIHIKESSSSRKKYHRKYNKRKLIMLVALAGYVVGLIMFVYWFICVAVLPVL